jgi:monoamine oxidase
MTLYSGGKLAHEAGVGTAEEVAARLMRGIERAYPGATKARNGKVSRFHWPTFPWTKASYACADRRFGRAAGGPPLFRG